MKNYFLSSLLALFFPLTIFAQENIDNVKVELNQIDGIDTSIESFDLTKSIKIHKHFYNDEWMSARILGNKNVRGKDLLIKYDILNQELNVNINNVAMVAPNDVMTGFVILGINQKFICINPKNWDKGKVFFEVLEEGDKFSLLAFHKAMKIKPNYNAALDAGSKDEKIVQKETFYLLKENKVFEIPRKKKAANKFFSKYSEARKHLKNNKVNPKNKEDLKALVRSLNEKN